MNKFNLDNIFFNFLFKKLYNKILVRGSILNKKNSVLIDSGDSFYSMLPKNTSKIPVSGTSINSAKYTFKSLLNDSICFKKELPFFFNSSEKIVSCLRQVLFCLSALKLNKNFKVFFLILKPVKGGFKCFYSGVKGFLPLSHFKKIYYSVKFSCINFLSRLNYFIFCTQPDTLFRLCVLKLKIFVCPGFQKKRFVKKFRRSKKGNILKFVFLIK